MERVEESRVFRCSGGPVTLDVTVGESQTGAITVHRGADELDSGADVLTGVPLGSCEDLVGATVTVRATVSVVSEPPRTSVTCRIPGGDGEGETFPGPDLELGAGVFFRIRYTFEKEA